MCRVLLELNVLGWCFIPTFFPLSPSLAWTILSIKAKDRQIDKNFALLNFIASYASVALSSKRSWSILLFFVVVVVVFSEESLFCDHEKNSKVKKPPNSCHTLHSILSLLCQW